MPFVFTCSAFSDQKFLGNGGFGVGLMSLLELVGYQVIQAAMGANGVVMATRRLDHDRRLSA